jgi:transcriptional regulator with GAF, ATPase, and Fis domain
MHETLIWRNLSRYPNLERSLPGTAALLSSAMPLDGVVVLRVEHPGPRPRVVAEDWLPGRRHAAVPTGQWNDEGREAFWSWHRAGRARLRARGGDVLSAGLWPEAGEHDAVFGPLHDDSPDQGVLLLVGAAGSFTPDHEDRAQRLLEPFSTALATDRQFHELNRLRETLEADKRALLTRLDRDDIIDVVTGSDAGMAELMERVSQVAPTDAPVLIFGETGAGKEVLARAIHMRSRRRHGPMVRVNCGAIPPGLVDSELFGHERGSFTGAVAARPGWFERADGGTLFLDEVGELPLAAQVRLLRVLQEGVLERVGGTRDIHVEVRVVAATHRDLEAMVRQGEFREDLWYRLNVFPLVLPPLRDRRHDLPELASHFAARAGRRLGGSPLVPSAEDIDLLLSYDWPGNIRELAAVIERAAILGDGKRLDIAAALGPRTSRAAERVGPRRDGDPPFPLLDDVVRRHIEEALRLSRGQVEGRGGAAEMLGINPHTLRSRMRKLKIQWARFR